MLQNASLLAIVAVHTAENELSEACLKLEALRSGGPGRGAVEEAVRVVPRRRGPDRRGAPPQLQTARSRLYGELR